MGMIESFFYQNQGYLFFESVGDTLIQGQNCKKLKKRRYWSSGSITDEGFEYFYSDSGKVYHYMSSTFYTLYDFTALPKDTWQISVPYPSPFASGNPPDTIVSIVVDSISSITIYSKNLKTLYVHSANNDWYFRNPIIENIGSAGGLFPYIFDWMDIDIPYLRCYSDTSIFYQIYNNISCDSIITGVFEKNNENGVSVIPNPADNYIIVWVGPSIKISEQKTDFTIIDITGNIKYHSSASLIENKLIINVQFLPCGLYFIKININNELIIKKILIQH